MEALKSWWSQASSRDQLALVVLSICVGIYALFSFILSPLTEMRMDQEKRVISQSVAFERIKNLAARVEQNEQGDDFADSGASVEKRIQASIAQHELRVSGFDASGRSGIRVRFDAVNYEKLAAFLYDVEMTQGIGMKDVTVAGLSEAGFVSASVLLAKQ